MSNFHSQAFLKVAIPKVELKWVRIIAGLFDRQHGRRANSLSQGKKDGRCIKIGVYMKM